MREEITLARKDDNCGSLLILVIRWRLALGIAANPRERKASEALMGSQASMTELNLENPPKHGHFS